MTNDIKQIHENLTKKLKYYIKCIINEYGNYMDPVKIDKLIDINNYEQIIKIEEFGNINAFATENNMMMPLSAIDALNSFSKIPGYGINKKHKTYNKKTIVINDNTFISYIYHVFISGSNVEEYYEDLLLHETMHYCGSDGASALKEGMNELLTRMIAQKYDLRTNSCGYPKEVKLVYELMKMLGYDAIANLAFIKIHEKEVLFLMDNFGVETAKLYVSICNETEKEFLVKYYQYLNSFNGVEGIFKKAQYYSKIDYSKVYNKIRQYQESEEYKRIRRKS